MQKSSSTLTGLLVIVGFIAVMVAIVFVVDIFTQKADKERTERLKSIAEQMNLEFYPADTAQIMTLLSDLQLFSRGGNRRVTNLMRGEIEGIPIALFDYHYVTGGKSSHAYDPTVVFFQSPTLNLPYFSLSPEGIFHKIGSVFGYQDIDFASYPGFSNHYLLRGSEEEGIRGVFTDSVLDFYQANLNLYTEGKGDRLVYYRDLENRAKPEQIQDLLAEGLRIFRLFSHSA